MKKILSVSKTTLRLLIRNGSGPGLAVVVCAVAVFVFFFARSDGILINELRIRLRYAFYFLSEPYVRHLCISAASP